MTPRLVLPPEGLSIQLIDRVQFEIEPSRTKQS